VTARRTDPAGGRTLLAILGSGETAPTMVTTHQRLFDTVGEGRAALVLDTPYGFQENADDLSARTQAYFARHVGRRVGIASFRDAATLSPVAEEALCGTLRDAGWLFAGPGSPTYLARQAGATRVPDALRDRLERPGVSVYASAAACVLGASTVPVYEIYKAGEPPHLCPGLDLLGPLGWDALVVPHFDNAEGGTHDTRFSYLGDRRLRVIEDLLPASTWVLGVDEHTALIADVTGGSFRVEGRGGVTVRVRDREEVFPAGTAAPLEMLLDAAVGRPAAAPAPRPVGSGPQSEARPHGDGRSDIGASGGGAADRGAGRARSPLLEELSTATARFDDATASDEAVEAAEATVALAATLERWAADSLQSDELDRVRDELRRQIVTLARLAQLGLHEHRDLVAPHVELLLELRARERAEGRYDAADAIRDTLRAGGVEVSDEPTGTRWTYDDPRDRAAREGDPG
jgi:hypothetical protein